MEILETLREYLPFLIPLIVVQFGLMIVSAVHVLRHETYKIGSRALWVIVCLLVTIIGPVLYFAIGKGENE